LGLWFGMKIVKEQIFWCYKKLNIYFHELLLGSFFSAHFSQLVFLGSFLLGSFFSALFFSALFFSALFFSALSSRYVLLGLVLSAVTSGF
jgi:hypothetical protein